VFPLLSSKRRNVMIDRMSALPTGPSDKSNDQSDGGGGH
jgi:hypothetical protein